LAALYPLGLEPLGPQLGLQLQLAGLEELGELLLPGELLLLGLEPLLMLSRLEPLLLPGLQLLKPNLILSLGCLILSSRRLSLDQNNALQQGVVATYVRRQLLHQ